MRRIFAIILIIITVFTLLSFTSCGKNVECRRCDEEISERISFYYKKSGPFCVECYSKLFGLTKEEQRSFSFNFVIDTLLNPMKHPTGMIIWILGIFLMLCVSIFIPQQIFEKKRRRYEKSFLKKCSVVGRDDILYNYVQKNERKRKRINILKGLKGIVLWGTFCVFPIYLLFSKMIRKRSTEMGILHFEKNIGEILLIVVFALIAFVIGTIIYFVVKSLLKYIFFEKILKTREHFECVSKSIVRKFRRKDE